jgi:hypothetical protein
MSIDILDPPIVLVKKELLHAERYENVTIDCHAIGRPYARIVWEKNGQIIDEHRTSHTRINQTMSSSRLSIQVEFNRQ